MKRLVVLMVLVMAVAAAACTDSGSSEATSGETRADDAIPMSGVTGTAAPPQASSTTVRAPEAGIMPSQLIDFAVSTIELDGRQLLVAVADTPLLRRQGLMNVTNLGDLDGMLFTFDDDTSGGFWMKDTLLPLDIAFFDSEGTFVDGFAMEPCETDDCPTYFPGGAYRYALEMVEGDMPDNPQELETE